MTYHTQIAALISNIARPLPFRLLAGMGLGLVTGGLPMQARAQTSPPPVTQAAPPSSVGSGSASGGVLGQMGRELSDILQQNRSGVVMIRGHRLLVAPAPFAGKNDKMPMGMANVFSGLPPIIPVIGSGFLVQGNVVVTTAEVAEDIQSPTVILADGKHLRVIGRSVDAQSNLAIFTVEGADTSVALRMGDSDTVLPGTFAVTIGTQAGFPNSGGLAFIAHTRRRARSGERHFDNLIQFQGAIGPGSSGSPLIGSSGEVIGIVMAAPDMTSGGRGNWPGNGWDRQNGGRGGGQNRFDKGHQEKSAPDKSAPDANAHAHRSRAASEMQTPPGVPADPRSPRSGGSPFAPFPGEMPQGGFNPFSGLSNIGFALPVNELRARLPELVRTAQKIPAAGWMGVRPGNGPKPGAYVTNLYEDCPAEKAGLKIGDIITQIDGQPIHSDAEFIGALVRGQEGQVMKVQVLRGNAAHVFEVRLRARPDPDEMRRMNLRIQSEVGVRIIVYFAYTV